MYRKPRLAGGEASVLPYGGEATCIEMEQDRR